MARMKADGRGGYFVTDEDQARAAIPPGATLAWIASRRSLPVIGMRRLSWRRWR